MELFSNYSPVSPSAGAVGAVLKKELRSGNGTDAVHSVAEP